MQRKCSICKKSFEKKDLHFSGLKCYCSPECGAKLAIILRTKKEKEIDKADRKELKARKDKMNETIPYWTKKTQVEFNKFIRLRDKNMPCISCGRHISADHLRGGDYDCGHYRSVGSCPSLRFDPMNAHKQCKNCNRDKSGNIVEYRIELARRIGLQNLEWLEGPHEPKRYRVKDLQLIHQQMKRLIKGLGEC